MHSHSAPLIQMFNAEKGSVGPHKTHSFRTFHEAYQEFLAVDIRNEQTSVRVGHLSDNHSIWPLGEPSGVFSPSYGN